MDFVNPPTSEEEVNEQEGMKKEEDFGKVDEKSMVYDMKPSNDLLRQHYSN